MLFPSKSQGLMIENISWTDPVPKGLYKELCMYSAHCMQLGTQCTQLCTVYTCTPGGVQGNIWTFVSSIFLHFLHILHLWQDAEASIPHWPRHRLPLWGLTSPSSSSTPSLSTAPLWFSQKFSSDSPAVWQQAEKFGQEEKLGTGHFSDRTLYNRNNEKDWDVTFFWFCCLCSQMALRSSRKLVDNVQVFQVELRLNVASKTFIPPSHSWNVVQSWESLTF